MFFLTARKLFGDTPTPPHPEVGLGPARLAVERNLLARALSFPPVGSRCQKV